MSKIKNYREHKSCQIDLDDGTKILLSIGHDEIKLFELGFLSIPKKTIYTFNVSFYSKLLQDIGYNLEREEVKELASQLIEAKNISELVKICKTLEEKYKLKK